MAGDDAYTPPWKRGKGGDDNNKESTSGGDVVQVKETGMTLRYPMLEENNYGAWAVKMEIFMGAQGVWAPVEKEAVAPRLDKMALAAIVQAIPESVMMATSEHKSTKKLWDTLKEMHVGEERVVKARVQTLRRELDGMYMGDAEKFSEFAVKVTSVMNEIRNLGTKMENVTVVEKLLRSVTDKFQPIVSTIEQWGNLETMSVAEVVGHLRAFEESLKPRRREKEEEKLLMAARDERRLTRPEWEAIAAEEKRNSDGSGDNGNKGGDKKKYRGRFDKSKIDCRNCVVGRLRAFEESLKPRRREREEEKLLMAAHDKRRLTRAEWEAIAAEEKRNSDGSGDNGNKGGDKKKYRGRFDKSKIDFHNCGEYGHFADECEKPKKMTKEIAQLAITGADDEPALL
ncbi:hypothetical protein U9M48_027776 [Paspalum notatum var. saurae]|uniref:CCHC-type domain-containing protein n=1 Tax=Paspalum notatum var. saurae TaxID=547442 RepID=A0AAQ3TZH8_PASNO